MPTRYDGAMKTLLPLAFVLALAACDRGEDETNPGGVTVGEARALDEAAEMIEQRRLPDSALTPSAGAGSVAPAGSPSAAPR